MAALRSVSLAPCKGLASSSLMSVMFITKWLACSRWAVVAFCRSLKRSRSNAILCRYRTLRSALWASPCLRWHLFSMKTVKASGDHCWNGSGTSAVVSIVGMSSSWIPSQSGTGSGAGSAVACGTGLRRQVNLINTKEAKSENQGLKLKPISNCCRSQSFHQCNLVTAEGPRRWSTYCWNLARWINAFWNSITR